MQATNALFEKAATHTKVSAKTIKDLNDKASGALRKIVDREDSGYNEDELAAARRLIEKS